MEAGREFQFLEVMGTNLIANGVVRQFNRTKMLGIANRVLRAKHALGGITDTIHYSTCPDSIYKIGKVRKPFFDEPASRGIGVGRIVN